MSTPDRNSGWSAYEKMVLSQLARLESDIETLDGKVTLLRIDVAQLKVKAGLWGALAGMIPAAIGAVALFVGGIH